MHPHDKKAVGLSVGKPDIFQLCGRLSGQFWFDLGPVIDVIVFDKSHIPQLPICLIRFIYCPLAHKHSALNKRPLGYLCLFLHYFHILNMRIFQYMQHTAYPGGIY